jgi:hypothetical protein
MKVGMKPDGTFAESKQEYADVWKEYSSEIAEAFGGRPIAYDPGVIVLDDIGVSHGLDPRTCQVVYDLLQRAKRLKEEEG